VDLLDQLVKKQYEQYPYPQRPLLARVEEISLCHASFEAGASLIFNQFIKHDNRRIGLFGCGTFEPHAFATTHPNAQITAIDLSQKTIEKAKAKCRLFLNRNVEFKCENLEAFSKHSEPFDFIHCYGVLHHFSSPALGFKSLARALKPNGFARVMVYSTSARHYLRQLQTACKLLNLNAFDKNAPKILGQWITSLPITHPLRLSFELNRDHKTISGRVDAFLHSCEKTFKVDEFEEILNAEGLHIRAWDFSQNLIDLIKSASQKTMIEKLKFLEAFHQWPASFTCWITKRQHVQFSKVNSFVVNPLFPLKTVRIRAKLGIKNQTLYSSLLKKQITLTSAHVNLLQQFQDGSLQKNILPKEKVALEELLAARFCLRVST
jgi:SAM-dependent methyltransferase